MIKFILLLSVLLLSGCVTPFGEEPPKPDNWNPEPWAVDLNG